VKVVRLLTEEGCLKVENANGVSTLPGVEETGLQSLKNNAKSGHL
jgi:hypothetical protein